MNPAAIAAAHAALTPNVKDIRYGIILPTLASTHLHNRMCHRELAGVPPGVLAVWTQQQHPENTDYITWLASDTSPWRGLRKEYNPEGHGWVLPADQPANLLYNFCIATRSPTDDQTGWSLTRWRSLIDKGINPSLAYALVFSVHPRDSDHFFQKISDTNHDVFDIYNFHEGTVQNFVTGRYAHLSALYTIAPSAVRPCSILWGKGGTAYQRLISDLYLSWHPFTESPRYFSSGLTVGAGTKIYDNTVLLEVAQQEQKRLGL